MAPPNYGVGDSLVVILWDRHHRHSRLVVFLITLGVEILAHFCCDEGRGKSRLWL
jgi:hypothetical protein